MYRDDGANVTSILMDAADASFMSLGRGGNGNEHAKQDRGEDSVTLLSDRRKLTLPKPLAHSFVQGIGGDNSGQGEYS